MLGTTAIYFSVYIEGVLPGGAGLWWASLPEETLRSGMLGRQMTAPATTAMLGATIHLQL